MICSLHVFSINNPYLKICPCSWPEIVAAVDINTQGRTPWLSLHFSWNANICFGGPRSASFWRVRNLAPPGSVSNYRRNLFFLLLKSSTNKGLNCKFEINTQCWAGYHNKTKSQIRIKMVPVSTTLVPKQRCWTSQCDIPAQPPGHQAAAASYSRPVCQTDQWLEEGHLVAAT